MRQRRLKNQEERLAAFERYMVKAAREKRGSWGECFGNHHPIEIEVGCGKGKFLTTLAAQYPERNFIGVEGQESVVLRAMEKVEELELVNVRFVTEYIRDIRDYFTPGELSGLYLNFSDPWPKERHAKRRLMHGRYLEGYREVLAPGSFIQMKTDNDGLYAFALESFVENGMPLTLRCDDLHGASLFEFGSDGQKAEQITGAPHRRLEVVTQSLADEKREVLLESARKITTEYEDKFRKLGQAIHLIWIQL